jgi:hypothetical protein
MPSDRAASSWPFGTAWIPARMTSAMYAEATMPRASQTTPYGSQGIVRPSKASGSRLNAMNTTIAGRPRKNSM